MAKRDFGPRHNELDMALKRLSRISAAEANTIAQAYKIIPYTVLANARINCQILSWVPPKRNGFWSAARAYGGDAARGAAWYAEHVNYSSVRPGSMPWGVLREALRDAAVAAVMADIAPAAHIDTLTGPVTQALPSLHHALTGR